MKNQLPDYPRSEWKAMSVKWFRSLYGTDSKPYGTDSGAFKRKNILRRSIMKEATSIEF